jgi:hypothetical protein
MCLERITDCVPRFVAHHEAMRKIQFKKASVFFEGASDCKDFLVPSTKVAGKEQLQALQSTVSAQTIRENSIVHPYKNHKACSVPDCVQEPLPKR